MVRHTPGSTRTDPLFPYTTLYRAESASQVRLRAQRTGALDDDLYLAAETDLATVLGQIDQVRPQLLIVDSVQTVSSSLSEGLAGGPSQVRERSEEHTSELQSLMRNSYAVFCLKKKHNIHRQE